MTSANAGKKYKFLDIWLLVFYFLLTFALYSSCISNFFVLDDFSALKSISEGSLSNNFHFFPVPLLIYRAFYLIFPMNPEPVRILHFVINALVCLFVFKLSFKVFRLSGNEQDERETFYKSFLCSLLFCIHYIHVETIVYFSELPELCYSLFYILGLYAYLSYRSEGRKRDFILIFIFYLLCQFSKETGVTFIACVFLTELFLFRSKFSSMIRKYYALFLIAVFFTALRFFLYPDFPALHIKLNIITIAAESLKNIIFTFTAFVVSLDFTFIKDIYKSSSSNYFSAFTGLLEKYPFAIAGILISAACYVLILRRRGRITYAAFIFIFITISSFMWLAGFERYLYLPSAGFCIMLLDYLFKISEGNAFKRKMVLIILALFFAYNIYSLKEKESYWLKASDISKAAVARILELTKDLPPGSKVYFKDLPGEYKSAWILRNGVHEIPELFLKRRDLYYYYIYQKPGETKGTGVYIYDYKSDKLYLE